MRALAKALAERALAPAAARARRGQARRGAGVILAYHNVVEPGGAGAGDRSLHLALDAFVAQMERLARTHRVVPLRELVEPSRPLERPRAAVTFDDAYRGALRLALPALAERGLPATVFVPPGLLGGAGFWWDLLADADGGGLPPAVRERALGAERGRPALDGAAAAAPSRDHEPATAEELARALALPGMEAASHTWSHPNLTALDDADLMGELERPRAWLRAHAPGAAVDHLSFPYGLWDERVARAAAEAGYRYLYRVEGGVAEPRDARRSADGSADDCTPAVLPRVNIPAGVTVRGFDLRAAGVALG